MAPFGRCATPLLPSPNSILRHHLQSRRTSPAALTSCPCPRRGRRQGFQTNHLMERETANFFPRPEPLNGSSPLYRDPSPPPSSSWPRSPISHRPSPMNGMERHATSLSVMTSASTPGHVAAVNLPVSGPCSSPRRHLPRRHSSAHSRVGPARTKKPIPLVARRPPLTPFLTRLPFAPPTPLTPLICGRCVHLIPPMLALRSTPS